MPTGRILNSNLQPLAAWKAKELPREKHARRLISPKHAGCQLRRSVVLQNGNLPTPRCCAIGQFWLFVNFWAVLGAPGSRSASGQQEPPQTASNQLSWGWPSVVLPRQ